MEVLNPELSCPSCKIAFSETDHPFQQWNPQKMNKHEVLDLLEANRNERGISNWQALGTRTGGLRSLGIGLTQLRKLAKKVGRDHSLAMDLWQSDLYDAKVIALLIDDPTAITREQAEKQVEELGSGMLSHVFASCDATLAKAPFVVELADDWTASGDATRRTCGYGLLYEISKFKGKKAPDEDYFLDHVERINEKIDSEPTGVRMAMGSALMGIGKRSAKLNAAALAVAERVGPIDFESASGNCDPFDVAKHLRTDRLKEKLSA